MEKFERSWALIIIEKLYIGFHVVFISCLHTITKSFKYDADDIIYVK